MGRADWDSEWVEKPAIPPWAPLLVVGIVVLLLATVLTKGTDEPAARSTGPQPVVPTAPLDPEARVNDLGFKLYRPFPVSLPPGWGVLWPGGLSPSATLADGQALLARSTVTGDGVLFLFDPTVVDQSGRRQDLTPRSPLALAEWFAGQPSVDASAVTRASIGGQPAWQVDLQHRPGARLVARCLSGGSCSPLFGLDRVSNGREAVLGTLPGRSSRALVLSADQDGQPPVPLLVWIWHTTGVDDLDDASSEIGSVVDSLDFSGYAV